MNIMKHLLVSILLLPVLSFAQSGPITVDKKIICETPDVAFQALTQSNPTEKPFWVGISGTSGYALLLDKKTGTWTLVQFNNEIVCVLGLGTEHQVIPVK
jgi:hypothetical protein